MKPITDAAEMTGLAKAAINALLPGRGGPAEMSSVEEACRAILAGLVISFSKTSLEMKIEDEFKKALAAATVTDKTEAVVAKAVETATNLAKEMIDPHNAVKTFFSRGKRKKKEEDEKEEKKEEEKTAPPVYELILRAASNLGTHGGKMPDARLKLGGMIPDVIANNDSASAAGVHSESACLAFRLSGADAQITSALRFLTMPISVNGAPSFQVAEVLAEDDDNPGPYNALNNAVRTALGPDALGPLEDIGLALRNRLEGAVPNEIAQYRKQLLVPISDGQYVAVSPVYSYGMAAELSRRIRERQSSKREENRQRISQRVVHTGGTKPQNAGLLPNFLMGEMPRLLAMPWTPEAGTREDVLRRLHNGRIPLPDSIVRKSSLENLVAAMSGPMDAKGTHTRIENALRAMVDDMLWAVNLLAEIQAAAEITGKPLLEEGKEVRAANRIVARLVGVVADEPLNKAERMVVTDRIAEIICARISGRQYTSYKGGMQTFAPGDEAHQYITHVAERALREFS